MYGRNQPPVTKQVIKMDLETGLSPLLPEEAAIITGNHEELEKRLNPSPARTLMSMARRADIPVTIYPPFNINKKMKTGKSSQELHPLCVAMLHGYDKIVHVLLKQKNLEVPQRDFARVISHFADQTRVSVNPNRAAVVRAILFHPQLSLTKIDYTASISIGKELPMFLWTYLLAEIDHAKTFAETKEYFALLEQFIKIMMGPYAAYLNLLDFNGKTLLAELVSRATKAVGDIELLKKYKHVIGVLSINQVNVLIGANGRLPLHDIVESNPRFPFSATTQWLIDETLRQYEALDPVQQRQVDITSLFTGALNRQYFEFANYLYAKAVNIPYDVEKNELGARLVEFLAINFENLEVIGDLVKKFNVDILRSLRFADNMNLIETVIAFNDTDTLKILLQSARFPAEYTKNALFLALNYQQTGTSLIVFLVAQGLSIEKPTDDGIRSRMAHKIRKCLETPMDPLFVAAIGQHYFKLFQDHVHLESALYLLLNEAHANNNYVLVQALNPLLQELGLRLLVNKIEVDFPPIIDGVVDREEADEAHDFEVIERIYPQADDIDSMSFDGMSQTDVNEDDEDYAAAIDDQYFYDDTAFEEARKQTPEAKLSWKSTTATKAPVTHMLNLSRTASVGDVSPLDKPQPSDLSTKSSNMALSK